jgi:hypothetical protein
MIKRCELPLAHQVWNILFLTRAALLEPFLTRLFSWVKNTQQEKEEKRYTKEYVLSDLCSERRFLSLDFSWIGKSVE